MGGFGRSGERREGVDGGAGPGHDGRLSGSVASFLASGFQP